MIEVRRATLGDKQAIFEFLAKAYAGGAQCKYPERWEWQFERNPFRNNDELPIWIAIDEKGTVVGQFCTMIEPLKIGTEAHRVSWGVDAFLLPEYRGQKIGFKLYQAGSRASDIFILHRMSEASWRILTTLGGTPIDSVAVFSRVARFDAPSVLAALRSRLHSRWTEKILPWVVHLLWLDRLVTALLNVGVWIRDIGLSRHVSADITLRQIDEFDHTADRLWDSVSPQFHATVKRDSKYLNWKYVQQPHMNYQLFTASRSGKVCGYVILRRAGPPENKTGIIADLFASPGDSAAFRSLSAFAVRYFRNHRVKRVSAASSSKVYKDALLALGFRKREDWTPLFHGLTKTPAIESALAPGSWFLGRSDSDSDFTC